VKNPYSVLGVNRGATDEVIRKAWLEMVRRYPPETAPGKFREIREAFETISTRTRRLRHYLFSTDCHIDGPIEALTGELDQPANRRPPALYDLRKMIERSFDAVYLQRRRNGKNDDE
jgi:curved DNA-binding protein CbpA